MSDDLFAEIDRLREELTDIAVDRAFYQLVVAQRDLARAQNEKLEAEIERLRAALTEIADFEVGHRGPLGVARAVEDIARRALDGEA